MENISPDFIIISVGTILYYIIIIRCAGGRTPVFGIFVLFILSRSFSKPIKTLGV